MGLTKQYLSYKSTGNFNIIVSGRPNINFMIYDNIEGRYVVVGAAEDAIIWDLRLNQKVLELKRENQEVTALRPSPDRTHIAVGYIDGVVKVFNIENQTSSFIISLHRTAVNVIRFDSIGMRLITGGLDTELVESDMITQTGKCRLIGHNASVTDAYFLDKFNLNNIVVSSSKDMQIKFWNLETQSCFMTIVDNHTEIWNLGLIGNFLVAGCGENAMNVYRITKKDEIVNNLSRNDNDRITATNLLIEGLNLDEDNNALCPINVQNCGVIQRSGKGRVVNIAVDPTEKILICHGTNNIIESFHFLNDDEARIRLKKRLKKSKESNTLQLNEISLTDKIKRLPIIKVDSKIKSIDVLIGLNDELRIIVSNSNNSLQLYSLMMRIKNAESKLLKSITQCGHHSEVRTVTFSSDSMIIASGSGESLKVWNRDSMNCIRTIHTEYILSICFVPGDRYILLGMKSGKLIIADISTGELLEEIPAHQNEIWSICLLPTLNGVCTGSGDTTVKFWNFEIINNLSIMKNDVNNQEELKTESSSILSLLHKNTLKLDEAVLCCKISPNNKFLAVGLLDSTVKIFFLDSFKFYLSLYGHKLPVLCMDISYDSNLIITGSADRNIKIWGMDFGDCHRSLFAHDDTIMALQFIPKTHMFFSCGKDGKIKQWDADIFEKIVTLPNYHIGEAYNLSISSNGKYLITCGSDRTLRLFERSDEPIVLQDVQEEERENYENQILATGTDNANPLLPGLKLPSKKTVGSELAAESILECLEICDKYDNDKEMNQEIITSELHPLMLAYDCKNCNDFLIAVLQRIRVSDLEEALMILPFTSVCKILEKIPKLAELRKDQTELLCKITLFLFKVHYKPIVSNQTLLPIISDIINNLQNLIIDSRDMIGFNLHALQLIQNKIKETEGIELFQESLREKKKRDEKHKKRQLLKRLHIQMS